VKLISLGFAALAVVAASCARGTSPQPVTPTSSQTPSGLSQTPVASPTPGQLIQPNESPYEIRYTGTTHVQGRKSFRLVMSGFANISESPYFKPSILVGSPGERIRLTVVNRGLVPFTHNFTLESQGIDHDIPWERTYTVTVTFPKSGALLFYCKYHVTVGQVGELRAS
jgi:plastocyanin